MIRTFVHSFEPANQSPIAGPTVALTIDEIEDAGLREVLQTPGVTFGSWSVLDALLQPTGAGTPFIFREPLGKAREVKVALSGLFGRFVARAYLERYFGLRIFAHLAGTTIFLNKRRRIKIARRQGARGDLPDWVACAADLTRLTVAEAKGCHDRVGPAKTLKRAWEQAGRIDVLSKQKPVTPLKRIAVATRWGSARGGAADAMLSVRDPDDEGEPTAPEDMDALFVGLLRLHLSTLLPRLGHAELASTLRDLADASSGVGERLASENARRALDGTVVREVNPGSDSQPIDGLVGGVVTRAGPVRNSDISEVEQQTLARLSFRPTFVGVEHDILRLAIDGDPKRLRDTMSDVSRKDEIARPDRAGGWVVPLGPGLRTLRDV